MLSYFVPLPTIAAAWVVQLGKLASNVSQCNVYLGNLKKIRVKSDRRPKARMIEQQAQVVWVAAITRVRT